MAGIRKSRSTERDCMRKFVRTVVYRGLALAVLLALGMLAVRTSIDTAQAGTDPVAQAMAVIRPESIRANMDYLADDLLEGRGTATRGHQRPQSSCRRALKGSDSSLRVITPHFFRMFLSFRCAPMEQNLLLR